MLTVVQLFHCQTKVYVLVNIKKVQPFGKTKHISQRDSLNEFSLVMPKTAMDHSPNVK